MTHCVYTVRKWTNRKALSRLLFRWENPIPVLPHRKLELHFEAATLTTANDNAPYDDVYTTSEPATASRRQLSSEIVFTLPTFIGLVRHNRLGVGVALLFDLDDREDRDDSVRHALTDSNELITPADHGKTNTPCG